MQPVRCDPMAVLPSGKSSLRIRRKSFEHKQLGATNDKKKGLRHIAAARKYNREEV